MIEKYGAKKTAQVSMRRWSASQPMLRAQRRKQCSKLDC